jgi:CubicO group peptidase (beta-lactamase class C family)
VPATDDLASAVDAVARTTAFSGVVRVDRAGETAFASAYGFAHRALQVPNRLDTQFGLASGVKAMTALTVMSLVEDGALRLDTTARSLLGDDLPLIGDDVTVEQLLAHRSGIGDFLDEDLEGDIADHVLAAPVHLFETTEHWLTVLDGHPPKFAPGERFSYCNGGYVVLALLAERATGSRTPFHDLVAQRVCAPAGMHDTAFLRSDELPARAALGYLTADGPRTNVLHLPVTGTGDGGIYSTAADVHAFWDALFAGAIVPPARVSEMTRSRSDDPESHRRYGLGFWLHATRDVVMIEGYDAGVSFRSAHDPVERVTYTVIANWSDGAWPLTSTLDELLFP